MAGNTKANHGVVSMDIMGQAMVLFLASELAWYQALTRGHKKEAVKLGQAVLAKKPARRQAKRKAAADQYVLDPGASSDVEIELQTEIYDGLEIPGDDLHASEIDLRQIYSRPQAIGLAEEIVLHATETMDAEVANVTPSVNPVDWTHDDMVDKQDQMRTAKVFGAEPWALLSTQYATPLKKELGFNTVLPNSVDGRSAYATAELPERIAGFRVFETNAFADKAYFGNGNSLGLGTSVPYRPDDAHFVGEIKNYVDPRTGLTFQIKIYWVHNPGKYVMIPSVYIGHKVIDASTLFKIQKAAA